jgi:hypothetical protein
MVLQRMVLSRCRLFPVRLAAALLAMVVGGCLAPYDQTSDQSITSLQKRLDSHIDSVAQSSAATQPVDSAFFVSVRNDVRSLRLRTEARGDDPSLKRQAALLDEISTQVDTVQQLEGTNLRGAQAWQTVKDGIGTNVKGFLTVELARKGTGQ